MLETATSSPLVTILITNYNYAKFLSHAIDSAINQTYKNLEIIIVDDASTDNSQNIIKQYADKDTRVKYIFNEANKGQTFSINKGYHLSKGDIICFLDSDDIFLENKVEEIVKYHTKGYDYIYTNYQLIDKNGNICGSSDINYKCDGYNIFPVYYRLYYIGCMTATLSITKNLARIIFPLPNEENWQICSDDLIVIQSSIISKSFFLDKKLTLYRVHNNNNYHGKKFNNDFNYEHIKKKMGIIDIALKKINITQTFLSNSQNLISEFFTHKDLNKDVIFTYLKILWYEMNQPFLGKIRRTYQIVRFLLSYYKNQFSGTKNNPEN